MASPLSHAQSLLTPSPIMESESLGFLGHLPKIQNNPVSIFPRPLRKQPPPDYLHAAMSSIKPDNSLVAGSFHIEGDGQVEFCFVLFCFLGRGRVLHWVFVMWAFSSCGSWAQLPHDMCDLSSQPGIEPKFPVLESTFLTVGPPGKLLYFFFVFKGPTI